MSNVRPRMNHANTKSSAARCAARALARNAHCRRRLAVGAVGQGPLSQHARSQERAVRPAAASARLKPVERKAESGGSGSKVRFGRTAIPSKRASNEAARRPCAYAQRQVARSVWAPAMRPAPPALVCFAIRMQIQVQVQGQSKAAPRRAWPNPSIEGTASGLRPPAAPHVKR